MVGNRVAGLLLRAPRTRSLTVSPSSAAPWQPPRPPKARKGTAPRQTPSDLQVQWGKIGAIHQRVFLTGNLFRSDPHQHLSCDSYDSCDSCAHNTQAKPTQLNGQTAAAASTHICRGLTSTNHITFPIYRQPQFGPTLPTLSGCHCCELRHLTAATAMAANSYCKRLGKSPIHSRAMSPTLYNRLPLDNRQRSARIHVANVQTS